MNKWLLVLFTMLLAGCTTAPSPKVNYYLLNSAVESTTAPVTNSQALHIGLAQIKVADYLQSQNLAMQLASYQLYYSTSHLWAEPIDTGIQKAVVTDLNLASRDYVFSNTGFSVDSLPITVGVQVDHFVATHDSRVIFAGHFWIVRNKANMTENLVRQPFHYTADLQQDGYPHAVAQLRKLINRLSDDILSKLKQVEHS